MKKSFATQLPLEYLIFFLDRNLGREKLPALLRDAGYAIKIHDEIFPQNEKDSVWLSSCGHRRWIVLTPDTNILKDPASMRAIGSSRGRVFFLSSGNFKAEVWATALISAYTELVKTIRSHTAPFIGRISPTGAVWLVKELTRFGREKKIRKAKSSKVIS